MGQETVCCNEFAERLKSCIGKSDTVARFGSDEFALLRTQIDGTKDVIETIGSLSQVLKFSFDLPGHELFATASVGVSLFPLDGDDCHTLLEERRRSALQSKEIRRRKLPVLTLPTCTSWPRAVSRSRLICAGRLQNEEFLVHYQPRVSVDSLAITGVEALVRWQHPQLGLVSPSEFIPLAEDTGLIVPIGEWVLRTACLQGRRWRDEGFAPIQIAVNISGTAVSRSGSYRRP